MTEEQEAAATALVSDAHADPGHVLEVGEQMISDLSRSDHRSRSVTWRAMSIAARLVSTMEASVSYATESVTEARATGDRTLEAESLLTLAGSLATSGRNEEAMQTIEEAARGASGLLAARVEFQRATVLARKGLAREALSSYSVALPVFEDHRHNEFLAMTLSNRGMVHLYRGELTEAARDLKAAREVYSHQCNQPDVAFSDHNLGMVAARRGDIPEALRRFDDSEKTLTSLLGSASEVQVSRCETLLSAGLLREALVLATEIVAKLGQVGLGEDQAEAMLVAAQAALAGGDYQQAERWATKASDMFHAQDRSVWRSAARLVGMQSRFSQGDTTIELMKAAASIAEHLDDQRQFVPAATAEMLAGRIALHHGLIEEARQDFARITQMTVGPVELRLQAFLANALLKEAQGNLIGADAAARAGMSLLGSYQAATGASDIRVGIERHARELGEIGLRLALDSKTPRRVFSWMERTKARSLALRPVTPPDDDAQAADLAELRRVTERLRLVEGGEAAQLSREQRDLQESIRRRSRTTTGEETADVGIARPGAITEALGDRTLVEFSQFGDEIVSIVIKNRRFSLRTLGAAAPLHKELESLRFVMRRLARGRASVDTAEEVARRLDHGLFGSLNLGDGPLVIVPTPALHATPWWALPTCRERSLTVSPSADLWLRAAGRDGVTGPTLVVAGPDLELSNAEVNDVADLYPAAVRFDSSESKVETVHAHLDGAGTAHIASHAFFQFENPMFSSIRLGDGDLTIYDIERLGQVPDLVVLSACDSGFTDTHAGEELMGLSSALLSMGTRSIVASVGLVPDSHATKNLMVQLHEGLVAGLDPADALVEAQTAIAESPAGFVAAASFVCIGAGWNSVYQEAPNAL